MVLYEKQHCLIFDAVMDRGIVEQAYCFFHQKYRVYEFSHSESQRDDIEYAISSYVDQMSVQFYALLSKGDDSFLKEHSTFETDIRSALDQLSALLAQAH